MRTAVEAYSGCSPGSQPTVTHFVNTYSNLTTRDDNSPPLDNYTDRQLGIFRFSRSTRSAWKRFTLAQISPEMSVVLVHSVDLPTDCIVALVVPDPWNTVRVFMTTVHLDDLLGEPFQQFNDDWVNAVVTNSTDGRINFLLCDKRDSITLEPFVDKLDGGTPTDSHGYSKLLNVSGEWMISCNGLEYSLSHFTEQIEGFMSQQREAQRTSLNVVLWLLGAIVVAILICVIVMKFIFRPSLAVGVAREDKITGARST